MPTAIKKPVRKPTLRGLSRKVALLRSRIEDLEDLRDLSAAVVRNRAKPGVPWAKARQKLGLDSG
jgi:hypothetical protein